MSVLYINIYIYQAYKYKICLNAFVILRCLRLSVASSATPKHYTLHRKTVFTVYYCKNSKKFKRGHNLYTQFRTFESYGERRRSLPALSIKIPKVENNLLHAKF